MNDETPKPIKQMSDSLYIPTDWTRQCEAKCRKTGKRCPHRCNSQIPNTIAHHPICDGTQFTVLGRPACLCQSHWISWEKRSRRLLTLPLIDGGHLSPFNHYGYGSVIIQQDRLNFGDENERIKVPKAWGVMRWSGKVPDGLLDRLPMAEGATKRETILSK